MEAAAREVDVLRQCSTAQVLQVMLPVIKPAFQIVVYCPSYLPVLNICCVLQEEVNSSLFQDSVQEMTVHHVLLPHDSADTLVKLLSSILYVLPIHLIDLHEGLHRSTERLEHKLRDSTWVPVLLRWVPTFPQVESVEQ